MRVVIITGMSGAGKSLATNYLEDIGYFCVDNLPSSFIPKFAEVAIKAEGKMDKVAMVVDIRGGHFLNDLFPALKHLDDIKIRYEILFLDANDDILIKRFKEARRNHPLSQNGRITDGIETERLKLKELKENASNIINTSKLTPRMLKERIESLFVHGKKKELISITILSFGFKYGIPIDSDLVFDVRFITNPYYDEKMRYQTGLDKGVKDFVLKKDETIEFVEKLYEILKFLIPNYVKEGKSQLIISIGCTGGRHRSVAISNKIYEMLKVDNVVNIEHRDIEKDNKNKSK
jgi:UPF0042 nucleotide-binding protein